MSSNHLPPQRIAKYDIERILGSGAMGVVYKACDSQIERQVAIKVLHEHLRQGDQGAELEVRFLQEAKAAARCLHPNIVTIFDFGADGAPYIVMEFVEGYRTDGRLAQGGLIGIVVQAPFDRLERRCRRGEDECGECCKNCGFHDDLRVASGLLCNLGET